MTVPRSFLAPLVAGLVWSAWAADSHWAFRPVQKPALPEVRADDWCRDPLDRFVLARLEAEGLTPSPEADRRTWLRRVSLDLVGLPPTPEELGRFMVDRGPQAHEQVVDALLASPRYGERWGQHWLDVVRYADTHGFEVNTERPNAWPYRDYVVAALNADVPFDRFVREQLAGDIHGADPATGFLVTASVLLPGQIGADDASKRLARQDALDEIVVNTGQAFLGLSVGCARCHDHKFDPVSAREYYEFQAFFAGVDYGDREMETLETRRLRAEAGRMQDQVRGLDWDLLAFEGVPRPGAVGASDGPRRASVQAARNSERVVPRLARKVRFTIRKTNNLEPCIDELEVFDDSGRNIALASEGTRVRASGSRTELGRHELRFIHDGQYGNSRSWMSDEMGAGWVELEFPEPRRIARVVWGRDRTGEFLDRLALEYRLELETPEGAWVVVADASDRHEPGGKAGLAEDAGYAHDLTKEQRERARALTREKAALELRIRRLNQAQLAFAGVFRKPDETRVLHRGDPEQPRDRVGPAVPSVLGKLRLDPGAPESLRRRELADWMASAENPLTARVQVNRVWQGHFGVGIVETPSDFGRSGQLPSHPELLDWLAAGFVEEGWSLKRLHRRIVLSATYRQSGSRLNPGAQARDRDNRLLWAYPGRRVEAEALRDAMLWVSGRLNLEMGGRGFDLFNNRGGLTGFKPVESFSGSGLKRMVYAHKVRREPEAVFGAFDCPDAGQSTARRRESTTPIQALNLFNSRFTLEAADWFAARVRREAGTGVEEQIAHAYRLAFGRQPHPEEVGMALPVVREHGLSVLCRALFNANEFLFIP